MFIAPLYGENGLAAEKFGADMTEGFVCRAGLGVWGGIEVAEVDADGGESVGGDGFGEVAEAGEISEVAVVTGSAERDGGESADDAEAGASEGAEGDAGIVGELLGAFHVEDLLEGALAEVEDVGGDGGLVGEADGGVGTGGGPFLDAGEDEVEAREGVGPVDGEADGAVVAGAGDVRVEEELVGGDAAVDGAGGAEIFGEAAGEAAGAGGVGHVGIVDSDEEHLRYREEGRNTKSRRDEGARSPPPPTT
jgi:hypothetical protein